MTNLLNGNGKFVTGHNKCSKITKSTTIQLANCSSELLFAVSLCGQQRPNCERAIRLANLTFLFFFKLTSSSNLTNKNLMQFGLEIQTSWYWRPFRTRCMSIWRFSYNDWYYHLPKYWSVLLNHPVYAPLAVTLRASLQSVRTLYFCVSHYYHNNQWLFP
jgi:hypothetical protein